MFSGVGHIQSRNNKNVGGRDTQPPTPGLRAAYNAAYAAAYVEAPKRAVSVFFGPARSTGRF